MWLVGNKRALLTVYLSLDGFVAIQVERILNINVTESNRDSLDALKRWLISSSFDGSIQVFLSGGFCRPFIAKVPAELSGQEADIAWKAAASSRTGLSHDCKVWRDELDSRDGKVAAAVETSVIDKLQALVQLPGRKLKIESIQPAWAEWLRASLTADSSTACTVLRETDSTTVIAGEGDLFELATTLVGMSDLATTEAAIERMLLVTDCVKSRPRQAVIGLKPSGSPFNKASKLKLLLEEIL